MCLQVDETWQFLQIRRCEVENQFFVVLIRDNVGSLVFWCRTDQWHYTESSSLYQMVRCSERIPGHQCIFPCWWVDWSYEWVVFSSSPVLCTFGTPNEIQNSSCHFCVNDAEPDHCHQEVFPWRCFPNWSGRECFVVGRRSRFCYQPAKDAVQARLDDADETEFFVNDAPRVPKFICPTCRIVKYDIGFAAHWCDIVHYQVRSSFVTRWRSQAYGIVHYWVGQWLVCHKFFLPHVF